MRMKYLPIVSIVFLVIAMLIQFVLSYQRNKSDIKELIDFKMELAQKDIIFELYDMTDAVGEIASYLPQNGKDTVALYNHIETVLRRFPDLYSCYFCYIRNYFPDQGRHHAVCALRKGNDSIISYHLETKFDYFERDWYKGALMENEDGFWSEYYTDFDTDSLIFTYSLKAYDEEGQVIGVAGADYTLSWTKQLLMDIRPYEDAECQLYGLGGELIVQTGEINKSKMIVSEKALSPAEMTLVIGAPEHHLWDGIISSSLITFIVLVIGILIAGMLVRRIWRDQAEYARAETENKVMEKELRIASNIQKSILRVGERDKIRTEDKWLDIELQAVLVPMREVGGDLYDFYRKGDDLYFIVGDVSGKSVPAAMFMSATVNLFRSATRRLQSPKAIMEEMNIVLSDNNPSMMFVTAFIGRLNIPTGELLYCNAGHVAPLHVPFGHLPCTIYLEPNIPLGYDGNYRFVEQGMMLAQDETLVLYTDGITEARNEQREMLGIKRWKEIVKNGKDFLSQIKAFIGKAEQSDDITLMTIRKTGETLPFSMRVENKIDQWPALKMTLHNYGLCAGLDHRTLKKMEVALEEAVVNIVNYSQAGNISLTLSHSPFTIVLIDDGVPFDPTQETNASLKDEKGEWRVGGLGIALLKQLADEIHYRRFDEKNELTIIKNC